MSKVQLKPFNKSDWDAFSGCEADVPKIGDITVRLRGANWGGVIIADDTTVQIHIIEPMEDNENPKLEELLAPREIIISRYTLNQDEAINIATTLDAHVSINDLLHNSFNVWGSQWIK